MAFKIEDLEKKGRNNVVSSMHDDLIKNTSEIVKTATLSIGEALEVEIANLIEFPEHTYEAYDDERMEELMNSIDKFGIQEPIIVWDDGKSNGKYIILAGHNRMRACKKLGWEKIPAIVKKNLTKDQATIIVNQTNMIQRSFENLSIYEKASSIVQTMDAVNEWRKKNPDNDDKGIRTNEIVGRQYGVKKSQVSLYIKLYKTFTKKQFKYVEEDKKTKIQVLSLDDAGLIASFDKDTLNEFFDFIEENQIQKVSSVQTTILYKIYQEKGKILNKDYINVLIKKKEKSLISNIIKLKRKDIKQYFPEDATDEEIWQEIIDMIRTKKGK